MNTSHVLSQLWTAVLSILNSFVGMSRFLEHTLGYGIGYPVFVIITATAALLPPISRWANKVKPKDGSQGISSTEAEKQTRLHFMVATILCAIVDGYVYYHGGVLPPH